MLVIEDTLRDPRVNKHPLVKAKPPVRFYAGAPLVTSDGMRIGSFSVTDYVPRTLSSLQARLIANFAQLAIQEIERKRLLSIPFVTPDNLEIDIECRDLDFASGSDRCTGMRDAIDLPVALVWASWESGRWPTIYVNEEWAKLSGLPVAGAMRFNQWDVMVPDSTTTTPNSGLPPFLQHLLLDDVRTAQLKRTLHRIRQGTLGNPIMFSVSAAIKNLNTAARTPVMCRFVPASHPINACAAAVRVTNIVDPSCGRYLMPPDGFPLGFPYFVIATPRRC